MDFTELFCDVDDFCKVFQPVWEQRQITSGERRRKHRPQLSLSEQMTIVIAFHASNYRDFKHFYLMLLYSHRADFPKLVSYSRFVRRMSALVAPLCAYLQTCYGKNTGIAFIDSTALGVLVSGAKRVQPKNGRLDVVCSDENITRTFAITGLDRIFGIFRTREEALRAAASTGAKQ